MVGGRRMKRLTRKDDLFSGGYEPLAPYCDVASKLGKFEDIEEAMGVDLILYLKMCVIEASVFILNKIINEVYEIRCPKCVYNPDLKAFGFKALKDTYNWRFPMSEYGKTWALTREELL